MHNVELLATVDNLKELKGVIDCGADAVYISYKDGEEFLKDLNEGIEYVHNKNKKIYVAIEVVPHNRHIKKFEENLAQIGDLGIDAIVITDAGMLTIVKKVIPNIEVHLSDQANITNYMTANFWYNQGVKRVLVSKELSFDEIGTIRAKTPLEMDIEAYIHGAMTVSHSGRPLLSNFIKSKSNNSVSIESGVRYNLIEQQRQGEFFPVREDERGTFFYNSKELCMIEYIPELIKCGITSFKIDGRMNNYEYTMEVVKSYREAIDLFYKNPEQWILNNEWIENLKKFNNREYTAGFYVQNPANEN
ncbi:MAG: U32 family peptidase [Clostridium sp.]|nr:U32 family peptidase [Clostridium sp.]